MSSKWFSKLIFLIILAWTFLTYFPPYNDSFVRDDFKHLEFIAPFKQAPLKSYVVLDPAWTGWHYRPVQHWLMLIGYTLFRYAPSGYYVMQVGLHILVVTLLYVTSCRLGSTRTGALLSAAIFAVHACHTDVVGWLSCFAITSATIFSLLSVYLYLLSSDRQPRWLFMAGSLCACWLALLSRHETLLVPLLILFLQLVRFRKFPKISLEWLFSALLIGAMVIYSLVQTSRTTWDPAPQLSDLPVTLINNIATHGFPAFVTRVFALYTLLDVSILYQLPLPMYLFVGLLVAGMGLWFWRANLPVRLGLVWCTAMSALLYVTVGVNNQFTLAERYLYLPGIGLALALGATWGQWTEQVPGHHWKKWVLAWGLCLVQFIHVAHIESYQRTLYTETRSFQSIAMQLHAALPNPAGREHFFLFRYEPNPGVVDYFQAMASVWYERDFALPGGSIERLKRIADVSSDYYLFDYRAGALSNLLPELQRFSQTKVLWGNKGDIEVAHLDGSKSQPPAHYFAVDKFVGPVEDQRLAIFMHPPDAEDAWTVWSQELSIPAHALLQSAVLRETGTLQGEDGMWFRIRIQAATGATDTLFTEFITPAIGAPNVWKEVTAPLDEYIGQTVRLSFEVSPGRNSIHDWGYWAIPRIVTQQPLGF